MRVLGPSGYKEMPWKNGGGSTTELLIHPPGATLEGGFLWRLSMAEVGVSGPFSSFPGVDRTLMLLSGNGMELDHGVHGRQVVEGPLSPVSFSGDWATEGRLLAGPCRDFNVMTRRSEVGHALKCPQVGREAIVLGKGPLLLVYCLEGFVEVDGRPLAEGELMEWSGAGVALARSPEGEARMAVVELWVRNPSST